MNENRGNWYLLTAMFLGLAVGLVYAYLVAPVRYIDTAPYSLNPKAKDVYRLLIAQAYEASGNLDRARQRLALLGDPDPAQALSLQAQRVIADGGAGADVRSLGLLSAALLAPVPPARQQPGSVMQSSPVPLTVTSTVSSRQPAPTVDPAKAVQTATVAPSKTPLPSPTITLTPTMSPVPSFTLRPTFTSVAGNTTFILKDKEARKICDPGVNEGLIQVQVNGVNGKPLAGVRIVVSWKEGEDTFYTGFIPEINPGYGDYVMEAGKVYSIRVGENSDIASNLAPHVCSTATGKTYQGGYRLEYYQKAP
ncbi:MAG TPA: hypothetical protein VIO61_13740 [Anaerolineaceae bacterium]